MKFKVQRKLNLANIDKELWPFETEDIGVEDADSFEEAQKMVDRLVAERIGYYKAKSEEYHQSKLIGTNVKAPTPSFSTPAPTPVPIKTFPGMGGGGQVGGGAGEAGPADGGGGPGGMPPEFNIA